MKETFLDLFQVLFIYLVSTQFGRHIFVLATDLVSCFLLYNFLIHSLFGKDEASC